MMQDGTPAFPDSAKGFEDGSLRPAKAGLAMTNKAFSDTPVGKKEGRTI